MDWRTSFSVPAETLAGAKSRVVVGILDNRRTRVGLQVGTQEPVHLEISDAARLSLTLGAPLEVLKSIECEVPGVSPDGTVAPVVLIRTKKATGSELAVRSGRPVDAVIVTGRAVEQLGDHLSALMHEVFGR